MNPKAVFICCTMFVAFVAFLPSAAAEDSPVCVLDLTAPPVPEITCLQASILCVVELDCVEIVCTNFTYDPSAKVNDVVTVLPDPELRPLSLAWIFPGFGYDSDAMQYGPGYYVIYAGRAMINGCD